MPGVLRSRRLFRLDQEGAGHGAPVRGDHRHRQVEDEARQQAGRGVPVALPQADSLPGDLEAGVRVCVFGSTYIHKCVKCCVVYHVLFCS